MFPFSPIAFRFFEKSHTNLFSFSIIRNHTSHSSIHALSFGLIIKIFERVRFVDNFSIEDRNR